MQWDNSSLEQWEQGHDFCVQLIDPQSLDLLDVWGKKCGIHSIHLHLIWKVSIVAVITLHFCLSFSVWKPVEGFEIIHVLRILSAECISAQVT